MQPLFLRFKKLIFLCVLIFVISGCAGGGSKTNSYNSYDAPDPNFKNLGSGVGVDVADYNGKLIYTLITSTPSRKPESNTAPGESDLIAFDISSTSETTQSVTGSALSRSMLVLNNSNKAYDVRQNERDSLMRMQENDILASGAKQISKDSSVLRSVPANITKGTLWNGVWILNSANKWVQVDTTCGYVSDHAYFFVENNYLYNMESDLDNYGRVFDEIYKVMTTKFGTVNDVDRNGKVVIVFTGELTGNDLGYFTSRDKYKQSASNEYSNQGDIFYLTADSAYAGDIINATLAHEFQHMIYFDQHYNHGVAGTYIWLNEALSQAAEYYNGYTLNHEAWMNGLLDKGYGGLSLTYWTSYNYGYGAIFIRYLIDQYGDTAIKNMCSTNKIGIAAVEAATRTEFNTIFTNFIRALVISGTGDSTNPLYNFKSLNLQQIQTSGRGGLLPSTQVLNAGFSGRGSVLPYGLMFHKWNGTLGTLAVSGTNVKGMVFGLSK